MTLPQIDGYWRTFSNMPPNQRYLPPTPPQRRIFQALDVGKAFDVFSDWNPPLSLKQIQRKTAFLVATATAKRASELASLRCSASFMIAFFGNKIHPILS